MTRGATLRVLSGVGVDLSNHTASEPGSRNAFAFTYSYLSFGRAEIPMCNDPTRRA